MASCSKGVEAAFHQGEGESQEDERRSGEDQAP